MSDEQTLTALRELVMQLTSARNAAMRSINTERPSHQSYHRGRASAFDSAIRFVDPDSWGKADVHPRSSNELCLERDKLLRENSDLVTLARALERINIAYRLGKAPSEKTLNDVRRLRSLIE